MKTRKNILIAFLLNLAFSVFEFVGGLTIGSIAIVSDALHDLGDALSIGIAYFMEKKSGRKADDTYTMGYGRYSVLGSLITTMVLVVGSVLVVLNATHRMIHPTPIHYRGMILFGIIGTAVNLAAALVTRDGESLNQRAVNLHMLEDVLGWCVVLIGAVVMRFTDWVVLDPLLSLAVAVYILVHAVKNLGAILKLFLGKTPDGISVPGLKKHLMAIEGVEAVTGLVLWSVDGFAVQGAVRVVIREDTGWVRENIRKILAGHGVDAVAVETARKGEPQVEYHPAVSQHSHCHHHYHH